MAPSVSIRLTNDTIRAIQERNKYRNELFQKDIESNEEDLLELLKNYESEKDPRGQVYSIGEIESIEIDSDGKGGFWVCFPINVYSGCRDMNEDYEEEMYITVVINFDKSTATLTGDELMPEREPDSY